MDCHQNSPKNVSKTMTYSHRSNSHMKSLDSTQTEFKTNKAVKSQYEMVSRFIDA